MVDWPADADNDCSSTDNRGGGEDMENEEVDRSRLYESPLIFWDALGPKGTECQTRERAKDGWSLTRRAVRSSRVSVKSRWPSEKLSYWSRVNKQYDLEASFYFSFLTCWSSWSSHNQMLWVDSILQQNKIFLFEYIQMLKWWEDLQTSWEPYEEVLQ